MAESPSLYLGVIVLGYFAMVVSDVDSSLVPSFFDLFEVSPEFKIVVHGVVVGNSPSCAVCGWDMHRSYCSEKPSRYRALLVRRYLRDCLWILSDAFLFRGRVPSCRNFIIEVINDLRSSLYSGIKTWVAGSSVTLSLDRRKTITVLGSFIFEVDVSLASASAYELWFLDI
ncbi:hypothetical protein LWI28_006894 [Acer negundo]|uniref:Uncharacterized protein n=1 Tax=Acer negundo TaxID=4023 RepID=A0AAD5IYV1_ACENE|nr:hypothetical protein LWI28_006894 [Acer negundo]